MAQIHAGWNLPLEDLPLSHMGAQKLLVVSSKKYFFQEGANFSCGSKAKRAWRAYLY